ncbi:cation:proton antiporter [Pseudoroseomonas cervicalis]|uniref:cation:proton antiporter domain-containing protein n=1 Tax=Teichococcus cervicalis TaxID=204525 RepID=UPI0027843FAB|nr:cation:proton antiporter [Pseudoroseomonas cervicalis]MDQ1080878.1 CPA2 family monovalent cation:H+ antiporter-2 [Pseudoroseomonas cervicalis]
MHHAPPLLALLVIALTLAFVFGTIARLLRLPPLIGYLVAGAVVGPHTPGFSADLGFTATLAEVGVGLLLFGVGLHFRAEDLLAVWRVALPGAVAQVAAAGLLGGLAGVALLGLSGAGAFAFGLALAIASTAVATRALEERGRLSGEAGRLALGWLVVQDLIVVLGLVLLPALSGRGQEGGLAWAMLRAVGELVAFMALMLLAGRRVLPWALKRVARTGSRELFTLAVVVVALGVAYSATALFHVSFALGAFFAGVVLGESDLGHQAAAETVPLQRVFAAIFFFSVGMLLDPANLASAPWASAAALLVVLIGTGGATFALLLLLRVPPATAAVVGAAMAQIGEFSFVLAELAIGQGALPAEARGPILLGSFGAILLLPLTFRAFAALAPRLAASPALSRWQRGRAAAAPPHPGLPALEQHAILVGYGRVGATIAAALRRHNLPLVVVEEDRRIADAARAESLPVIWGDAAKEEVLQGARPHQARLLILALPGAWEARQVIALARAANPAIEVAVRTHDDEEVAWLRQEASVGMAVMGEREVALGMADFAMQRLGVSPSTAQATVDVLRARMPGEGLAGEPLPGAA